MTLVFVYGTLKSGFGNHRLLENSEFVGAGWTVADVRLESRGCFPALLLEPAVGPVFGEVYRVTDEELMALDHLEGYPHHYDRTLFDIELDDDRVVAAVAYFQYPGEWDERPAIESGVWER